MGLNFPIVYAAWSLDENVRYQSTSGGVFTELAKVAIANGYHIAGAKYNKDFTVEHDIISSVNDIKILRQSKYVESSLKDIRTKMQDKKVMFVGAPCQAASVKADIKVDFICRGANMQKAYVKYLDMLKNRYNSNITNVWFKNKTYGWHKFSTQVDFENGQVYLQDRSKDLYMLGYIKYNLYIKPVCYQCKFRSLHHNTDITLGDFWGVRKSLDNDKGTSVVFINTAKGYELFMKTNTFKQIVPIEEATKGNRCLLYPPIYNEKSELFMSLLNTHSFDDSFIKGGIK